MVNISEEEIKKKGVRIYRIDGKKYVSARGISILFKSSGFQISEDTVLLWLKKLGVRPDIISPYFIYSIDRVDEILNKLKQRYYEEIKPPSLSYLLPEAKLHDIVNKLAKLVEEIKKT